MEADECFDGATAFAFGGAVRTDGVFTDRGRYDKCLGIMHYEWLKGACRAFYDQFVALDDVQYVHTVARAVCHRAGKPMASCLDKFILVQPCAFLAPTFAFGNGLHTVDESAGN